MKWSLTPVALVALFSFASPQPASAKILLQCTGLSQHRCLGKFGCMAGDPGCEECLSGPDCQNTNTCFSGEQFVVEIDGANGEVDAHKYDVETFVDAYRLTPVDPKASWRRADDVLSIGRLTGDYMWWPVSLIVPLRSGWHYEEGLATLNPTSGCHTVKPLF